MDFSSGFRKTVLQTEPQKAVVCSIWGVSIVVPRQATPGTVTCTFLGRCFGHFGGPGSFRAGLKIDNADFRFRCA